MVREVPHEGGGGGVGFGFGLRPFCRIALPLRSRDLHLRGCIRGLRASLAGCHQKMVVGGLVWFGLGQRLPRTPRPTVSATVPARLHWVGRSRLSQSQGVPDC